MISRGFKPVGWVAALGAAALGCYMLSLNVAAERAELARVERKIVAARQEIRSLQTELGTRGRLAQLDRWNADVLALSAPAPRQFLKDELTLARFDRSEPQIAVGAEVRLASAAPASPAPVAPRPQIRLAAAVDYAAAGARNKPVPADAKPLVQRAALAMSDAPPFKPVKAAIAAPVLRKASLLDDKLIDEIASASRSEKKGAGGAGTR